VAIISNNHYRLEARELNEAFIGHAFIYEGPEIDTYAVVKAIEADHARQEVRIYVGFPVQGSDAPWLVLPARTQIWFDKSTD